MPGCTRWSDSLACAGISTAGGAEDKRGCGVALTGGAAGVGAGTERCGGGGFGRCERVSGVGALVGATKGGGAGRFGATGAVASLATGGRDGGRGGAGRLRLPGGAESGRWRTGGGGGRLRTGPASPSDALGDDGGTGAALEGAAGAPLGDFDPLAAVGDEPGRLSRGRGGTEGGTDVRPNAGLGGEGFFDWFASSAMVHELTPSLKRAKCEHEGEKTRASAPSAATGMLCGGAL